MPPLLSVENIECRFGQKVIVDALSFDIAAGEICCLLGPSGCGKTTLLQAIAGFNPIYSGTIELEGRVIASPGDARPPEQRGIGMVFQDYALFPHLTVEANIGFGLKSLPFPERVSRTREALELVQMEGLARRYPHELSGGQQQRVALARALAPKPRLLLMDEPFSNLDTGLRRTLSAEVRQILKTAGMTAIMVTHDRDEAFVVSDRLGVLDNGRLEQWDTPEVVYHRPATPPVASFVSEGVFIDGVVREDRRLETEIGEITLTDDNWPVGTHLEVFVRPEEVGITRNPGAIVAEVVGKAFMGTQTRYRFRLPSGRELDGILSSRLRYQLGDRVGLAYDTPDLVAFAATGEQDSGPWHRETLADQDYTPPRAVNQ